MVTRAKVRHNACQSRKGFHKNIQNPLATQSIVANFATIGDTYIIMYRQTDIRFGRREDAPLIAQMVMEAMSEECCRHFYGERHTAEEFHAMMTELASRQDTQYSYQNTLCALGDDDEPVGIAVCYDGGELHRLRRAFVEETLARFGRDFSDMPDETEAGELYLDSLCVLERHRGQGIATTLLHAAARWASAKGMARVGLLVDYNNPRAERLYLNAGFKYAGDKLWGGHKLKHLVLLCGE